MALTPPTESDAVEDEPPEDPPRSAAVAVVPLDVVAVVPPELVVPPLEVVLPLEVVSPNSVGSGTAENNNDGSAVGVAVAVGEGVGVADAVADGVGVGVPVLNPARAFGSRTMTSLHALKRLLAPVKQAPISNHRKISTEGRLPWNRTESGAGDSADTNLFCLI